MLLDALGVMDRECMIGSLLEGDLDTKQKCRISFTEFASNIIFENVFDKEKKKSFVAVRYNGDYLRVCDESKIAKVANSPKEKYLCGLTDFDQFIQTRIEKDWRNSCGLTKKQNTVDYSKYQGVIILVFSINIALVFLLVVIVMVSWSTKRGYVQSSAEGLKGSIVS